jgi:hypothetical protein
MGPERIGDQAIEDPQVGPETAPLQVGPELTREATTSRAFAGPGDHRTRARRQAAR